MTFQDHARLKRWRAAEQQLDTMLTATDQTIARHAQSPFDVELSVDTAVLLIDACEHLANDLERTGREQSELLRTMPGQARRVAKHYDAMATQLRAVSHSLKAHLLPQQ